MKIFWNKTTVIVLICSVMIFLFGIIGTDLCKIKADTLNYKNKLLILGDSIGAGQTYGTAAEPYGYGGKLNAKLQLLAQYKGLVYINNAHGGDRTQELITRLKSEEVQENIKDSYIISLSIGGNNLLMPLANVISTNNDILGAGTKLGESAQDFENQWVIIMEMIRELNPTAEVYVQTIYNPLTGLNDFDKLIENKLIGNVILINNAIKKPNLIYKYKYNVVDIYELFNNSSDKGKWVHFDLLNGADPHPTDLGYMAMADEYYKIILEKGTPLNNIKIDGSIICLKLGEKLLSWISGWFAMQK